MSWRDLPKPEDCKSLDDILDALFASGCFKDPIIQALTLVHGRPWVVSKYRAWKSRHPELASKHGVGTASKRQLD